MSDYLVIVESPKKAKKIKSYLGKDFNVIASFGHVYDLPVKKLGIDIKKDFTPSYDVMEGKNDVKKNIATQCKKAKIVYLMSDRDREGAGIARNIYNHLPKNVKVKRAVTSEIKKQPVINAINNAYDLDDEINLVYAYEARRILDRLVGYKCSYITKQATGGRSAGRCQSVALRIIVDREKAIQNFVPIVYWPITAELLTQGPPKEKVIAVIKNPDPLKINTKEEAEKIIAVIKKGPVKVSKFEQKNVKQNPYPPFQMSTLYQAGSSIGITMSRTKVAAQSLYENGLITYHRTDSVHIASGEISKIRSYIKNNYDQKYSTVSPRFYKSSTKNAQEAHEAIRPTEINTISYPGGTPDEKKIYELIWRRTIASQMASAEFLRSSAEFKCNKYILSANGSKELFDGFKKVWTYMTNKDKYIPTMKVGDILDVIDIFTERKETQPPKRYSESSLVEILKKDGIGRPSTYESIVKTIENRKYVEKKKKMYHATGLGINVSNFLVASDFCFMELKFTSKMENDLDDIANKKADRVHVLSEFWQRLKKDIENAKKVKNEQSKTKFECPDCKANKKKAFLLKKFSKFGPFFSCENYKKDGGCKYTAQINDDGTPKEKAKKIPPKKSKYKCPKCGYFMLERNGPYGKFLGCEKFPVCRSIMDMDGNIKISKKSKKKKWGKKH